MRKKEPSHDTFRRILESASLETKRELRAT